MRKGVRLRLKVRVEGNPSVDVQNKKRRGVDDEYPLRNDDESNCFRSTFALGLATERLSDAIDESATLFRCTTCDVQFWSRAIPTVLTNIPHSLAKLHKHI